MWASGAALTVRSSVYLSCGGLDKDFFAHMEEIDLCWRMRLAGWKLAAVPASVVYHLGGGSLPAENPRKTYLNFRNNLLMLHKNLPDSTRRSTLLRRRLLDTIAWTKYIATLDFKTPPQYGVPTATSPVCATTTTEQRARQSTLSKDNRTYSYSSTCADTKHSTAFNTPYKAIRIREHYRTMSNQGQYYNTLKKKSPIR